MSQKKLKKLRKLENINVVVNEEPLDGIRKIIKMNWKFLILLSLGIFLLYFNSLRGDFVSDDYATIPQNSEIMSFSWAIKGLFVSFSNWLIAITFGIINTFPYHLFNLLLYLFICILAFIFLYIVFDRKAAVFSTILFSVLPIHVEAVSWISGKPYLFNTASVLLSLIFFVYFIKTNKSKYLWFFVISLPLAYMSEKVRSLSIAFLIPLYILSFGTNIKKNVKLGKIFIFITIFFVTSMILLWPHIESRISAVNSGVNKSDSNFYDPFFQYPTAIPKYLQLIFIPVDLTLYHTMYVIPLWLNWAIFLMYIGLMLWCFFKDKKIFFALAFVFAATAPSMAPVKVSWLVAERYILLGSLGFCTFLVLFFQRFNHKFEKLLLILFVMLVGAYCARIFDRNIDWQTNHNLWVNTCQVSPNSHNAWNNIGDDYDKLANLETNSENKNKQYLNSIKGFGQSYAIKPNYADAYHNQANIFYKIGRLDLARNAYETALYYNPMLYQTYITIIQIDLQERNEIKLIEHLAKLQQVKPNDLQVAYITGVSYFQIGRIKEAKQIADVLYKQFPDMKQIKEFYDLVNKTLLQSQ